MPKGFLSLPRELRDQIYRQLRPLPPEDQVDILGILESMTPYFAIWLPFARQSVSYPIRFPLQFSPGCGHFGLQGSCQSVREEINEYVPRGKFKLSFFDCEANYSAQWTCCPANTNFIEELEITIWLNDNKSLKEAFEFWRGHRTYPRYETKALSFVIDRVLKLGLRSIGPIPQVPQPTSVKHLILRPRLHDEYFNQDFSELATSTAWMSFVSALVGWPLHCMLTIMKNTDTGSSLLDQMSILWPDHTLETLEDDHHSGSILLESGRYVERHPSVPQTISPEASEKVEKKSPPKKRRVSDLVQRSMSKVFKRSIRDVPSTNLPTSAPTTSITLPNSNLNNVGQDFAQELALSSSFPECS